MITAAATLFAVVTAGDVISWLVLGGIGAVAICALILTLAFKRRRPDVFLKRADGRLGWASWILFWPYYLYNHLIFNVWRKTSREMPFDEIVPGLFLGRRLGRGEAHLLECLGPVAVLDLTAEFQEAAWLRQQAAYLCLPTLDMTPPTEAAIRRALDFIREHLGQRPVYVHCALGHGRSAVIVLAHLLATGQCSTITQALELARSRRPGISLTSRQKECLRPFIRTNKMS